MANPDHVKKLKEGVDDWNNWRKYNDTTPDLSYANLSYEDLSYANLNKADLREANLNEADLREANLKQAKLNNAKLEKTNLSGADLQYTNLYSATLSNAQLNNADLSEADLREADLNSAEIAGTDFSNANLIEADFSHANSNNSGNTKFINSKIQGTNFTEAKLKNAKFIRAKAGLSIFTLGYLKVIILSLFFSLWSAFPACIIITFNWYFLKSKSKKIFKKRPKFVLLSISILSTSWALFIRTLILPIPLIKKFITLDLHIGIGTAMIMFIVLGEYIVIRHTEDNETFMAEFRHARTIIIILIIIVFFVPDELSPELKLSELKALFGAILGSYLGSWVSYSAITGKYFNWLWRIFIEDLVYEATSFKGANLDGAVFNSSSLTSANFIDASINKTLWHNITDLDCIVFGKTYLQYPQIRKIFRFPRTVKENIQLNNLKLNGINLDKEYLHKANFTGTNLSQGNLTYTVLSEAIMLNANLNGADLTGANLNGADLTGANLNGADLTGANLNGACLKDFNYDEKTIFKDVTCKHLNLGNSNRNIDLRLSLPVRHLKSGDFENFFKREEYAKLLIRNTDNLKAINYALSRIIKEYKIEPDSLRGIRSIGDYTLVEFKVPENSNKFVIEQDFENKKVGQLQTTEDTNNDSETTKPETIRNTIIYNFDQRRQIKIYDATIFANGTASFNVGDIETVADTINQLPTSTDSNQPGIKELLDQLLESIKTETELKEGDKSDAIEELQNLAEASQDDDQNAKKTKARKSLRTLVRIVNDLPPTAALIDTCQELLTAIAKLFE